MDYAIAVDLGGTHLRAALVTRDGTVSKHIRLKTRATEGQAAVLTRIAESAQSIAKDVPAAEIAGVGVTAPGPVDHRNGIVKNAPNLPGWNRVPLAKLLHKRLNKPVFLGNDANLAGLGEHRFGAGRGFANMIYITVSTGIGGGIIVDNELLLGEQGLAAEVGHIPLALEGPLCGCGHRGHLEALASGPNIAREAKARLHRGHTSTLSDLDHEITAVDVTEAARAGDEMATDVLERAGHYLGLGLAVMLHLFDTERFVIGGGVSNAGDLLLEPARQSAVNHVMPPYRDTFDVVLAELGDAVALMGAAALVFGRVDG